MGSLGTAQDGSPGGLFRILIRNSKIIRRVVGSSEGGELPPLVDTLNLVEEIRDAYQAASGRVFPSAFFPIANPSFRIFNRARQSRSVYFSDRPLIRNRQLNPES